MNLANVSLSTLTLSHNSQHPTTPPENQLQMQHIPPSVSLLKQMLERIKTSKWHQALKVFGTYLVGLYLSSYGRHEAISISPAWYPWVF